MRHINIEMKARCSDADRIRGVLRQRKADFKGTDLQTDTYFKAPSGRLKLREGNIENALIFYNRPDVAGPKRTEVSRCPIGPDSMLKDVLSAALGVLAIVKKKREIYFIDNVKFHIDSVEGLGGFVEIEAIDEAGEIGRDKLLRQCRRYMKLFAIADGDLVEGSYCDMVRRRNRT